MIHVPPHFYDCQKLNVDELFQTSPTTHKDPYIVEKSTRDGARMKPRVFRVVKEQFPARTRRDCMMTEAQMYISALRSDKRLTLV